MEIREELPDCHVYIYYMDIRTFGLYETKYYWKSQEEFKVKYIKARIAEVTSDGEKLVVKGEDTLVKRPITIPFDMVVHAIGMDPNVENPAIAATFGVEVAAHPHDVGEFAPEHYVECAGPAEGIVGGPDPAIARHRAGSFFCTCGNCAS